MDLHTLASRASGGEDMYTVDIGEGHVDSLPQKQTDWTDPLIVYRREASRVENLVVFVHGLGGEAHATWGRYPEFILSDRIGADVGLLDYESGLRRRPGRSIGLGGHASAFSHSIRDIKYRKVVLVGHSMGGLLCKAAIRELLNSDTRDSDGVPGVDKVAGLLLFATPQAGSRRVPGPLTLFSKDARDLRAGSTLATEANQCFQDRLITTTDYVSPSSRKHIPTFAVIATGDRWVDRLSSGLGLGTDQQKIVTGSHSSIVRPASKDDDAYVWFRERVVKCFEIARPDTPPLPPWATTGGMIDRHVIRDIILELFQGGFDLPMHTDVGMSQQPSDDTPLRAEQPPDDAPPSADQKDPEAQSDEE
jgi:pimeloyl-ACP methyl ester carboxylesterase